MAASLSGLKGLVCKYVYTPWELQECSEKNVSWSVDLTAWVGWIWLYFRLANGPLAIIFWWLINLLESPLDGTLREKNNYVTHFCILSISKSGWLLGPKLFSLALSASINVPSGLTLEIPTIQILLASVKTCRHNWVSQQLANKVGLIPR